METGDSATIGDGRYAIDRRIGIGGGGAVYLCYDTVLNRWVAIKRVEPDGGISDPFQEARQLASLQHPNIVTVYDFLRSDDGIFVVMEFVSGQNLNELTEPLELELFLLFAHQSLEGLAAAHSIGMVHRDIKPANIMLSANSSGELLVKLLDFGLAKVMTEPREQTMDHSGSITGSIHTISPEQLRRIPMDHRADIYSLGCVFYKVLTQRFPFNGPDVPSLIAAHLQHDFLPLAELRPDLPAGLIAWVEKLFAFDQNGRPQTATEAIQSLEHIRKKLATPARPNLTGKPFLAAQPPPPNKSNPPAAEKESSPETSSPFFKSQITIIAMVTVIAVCLTLATLALTGNFGGGGSSGSKSHLFAKKEKPTPTPAERTSFRFNERGDIQNMVGKRISVSGTIERFEEDLQHDPKKPPIKGRFLLFKDSGPRDVMVYFDPQKTESSAFALKRKFVGNKVQATGTVVLIEDRLLLDMSSPDGLELTGEDPTTSTN